jgi:hypothetical protein
MKNTIQTNFTKILVILLIFIGLSFAIYYISKGQNLLYGDALSRLNISRKLIDNLTPGIGQMGNVWLPLPMILMLPFNFSSFLWHTGISGAIISIASYVIGGYFVYKSIFRITNSIVPSLFGTMVYALNINLLYLQTTAMSEPVFICCLAAIIYHFIEWFLGKRKHHLLQAALWISVITLVRYEGLALLLVSIPLVFTNIYTSTKKYSKAEGETIFYTTLAGLGFLLWTFYLWIIFKDPLYWIHYYAGGTTSIISSANASIHPPSLANNIFSAIWKYITSMVWMIGLPAILFSLIGFIVLTYHSVRKRNVGLLLALLLPLSIFIFMIATLMKNTPIGQPELSIANLLSGKTSLSGEFNIRYGILLLPWIAILSGYAFNIKNILLKLLIVLFFAFQIVTYIFPKYTLIFKLPVTLSQGNNKGTGNDATVKWLKGHYDNGLILVSALKHDPEMFWLGFDYKTYIHEGTQKYWIDSLKNPQKYAKWIIMTRSDSDYKNSDDPVTKNISGTANLKNYYKLVYEDTNNLIYIIKK